MWQTQQGVNGLRIDKDNHIMKWYDVIGCGCGMDDGAIKQPITKFLIEGVPVGLPDPPADILQEIDITIESLKML